MKRDNKSKWGFLLGLALAISFCSTPAWANDVKYIYYPSSQVYFNPGIKHYYYMDNGTWVDRNVAPVGITLGNGVDVNLGGDVPYVYHAQVIKQYPTTYVVHTNP